MRRIDKEIKYLEFQKLKKEIEILNKPWIKDKIQFFSFLSSILTFLTVLVTYVYLIFTGYFDKRKLELEIDKKTLAYETQILSSEKDSLNNRKAILTIQLDSLKEKVKYENLLYSNLMSENESEKKKNIFLFV